MKLIDKIHDGYMAWTDRLWLRTDTDHEAAPPRMAWIVLGLTFVVFYCCFFYGDTEPLINYEMNFWAAIFRENGGPLTFYDYQMMMVRGEPVGLGVSGGNYATYEYLMYVILGIWGLPLWLIYGLKGLDPVDYLFGRIYGKAVFAVALAICIYLVYSICLELGLSKQRALWGAFVFLSSALVFVAVAMDGQADAIGVVFTLLGVRAYLRDRKGLFLLFFMLAIPCKQYALFVFLPLLLLYEKNLVRIAVSTAIVLLMKIPQGLLFDKSSEAMMIMHDFNKQIYERMTANGLPLMLGFVPVTIIVLVIPCVIAYLHRVPEDRDERNRYAIYLPFLTLACLFSSFESSSYWYLHLTPYVAIMLVYNTGELRNNFILETAGISAMLFGHYGMRSWPYDPVWCNESVLGRIVGLKLDEGSNLMAKFATAVHLTKFAPACYAAYIVIIAALLIINRPSRIRVTEGANFPPYAYIRFAVNTAVCFVPVVLYIFAAM